MSKINSIVRVGSRPVRGTNRGRGAMARRLLAAAVLCGATGQMVGCVEMFNSLHGGLIGSFPDSSPMPLPSSFTGRDNTYTGFVPGYRKGTSGI